MKKITIITIAFCLLLISCKSKNSSAAETTLNKTIAEAAGETSTNWNGKLTELFTVEMAAAVTGYAQAEAKQDYNQVLKNAATHSLAYRWEKGRSKGIRNPINNKTMEIPTDDFIQLAWVRTTTLQQFKQNYHTPTAEEKANAEQAMKGKLKQMEKEGTISSEQSASTETIATGLGDGLSFTEIPGVGDYAVWNNKQKQLKVLYKGLEFEITAEVSNDEAVNKQKSIEAAKLIIQQKL